MRYGMSQQQLADKAAWQQWCETNKSDLNADLDEPSYYPCVVVWQVDAEWGCCYVEYVNRF